MKVLVKGSKGGDVKVLQKYLGNVAQSGEKTEEAINRQIERNQKILTSHSETGVVIDGLPNPQIKLSSCCNPIPGDEIVGYVTKGNGIAVHHKLCKNLKTFQQERLLPLTWAILTVLNNSPCSYRWKSR